MDRRNGMEPKQRGIKMAKGPKNLASLRASFSTRIRLLKELLVNITTSKQHGKLLFPHGQIKQGRKLV